MKRDRADVTPFAPLGPQKRHYWLALRMAKATGTDLAEALAKGGLTQSDWAGIVTRCRACQWTEGCRRWLQQPIEEIRALPEGCPNAPTFAALQEAAAPLEYGEVSAARAANDR